ncbi:MAG: hypothetical protein ACK5CA_05910 [Cyanobacteriota bacterium]|jgi:hypothetical protein
MDINLALGILGVLLSVVSIAYAIYVAIKSKREKMLLYDIASPAAIADIAPKESNHSIKIIYEKPGCPSETVDGVFVRFVRFTNFGRMPIRKEDLAYSDPLRIEVTGGKILDMSLVSVVREVSRIKLGPVSELGNSSVAPIDFDFLDHMDGGLIQIVSDSLNTTVAMRGTVVEMPRGIKMGVPSYYSISIEGPAAALLFVTWLALLVATPFVFWVVMGSWANVWLMFVPIISLAFPLIVLVSVGALLGVSRRSAKFPSQLTLPRWYRSVELPASRRSPR